MKTQTNNKTYTFVSKAGTYFEVIAPSKKIAKEIVSQKLKQSTL